MNRTGGVLIPTRGQRVTVRLDETTTGRWVIDCRCCHETDTAQTWADAISIADQHVRTWHS